MGTITVNIRVCRIDKPEVCADIKDVVVDTGSTVSASPQALAKKLGIGFSEKRKFTLGDGTTTVKQVGHALIEIDSKRTADEVIAIAKGPPLALRPWSISATRSIPRLGL